MTLSTRSSQYRRRSSGIAILLTVGLVAGCAYPPGSQANAPTSGHAVYGSDGHYGGWGTGFGSDGSRGRS